MNDLSLQRANAFLAAVSQRVAVGETLQETPAEIGRDLDLPDPLSTARAVRALIARRRLEPANGSYRLLDARPLDPGERESIGRRPRRKVVPSEGLPAAAGRTGAVLLRPRTGGGRQAGRARPGERGAPRRGAAASGGRPRCQVGSRGRRATRTRARRALARAGGSRRDGRGQPAGAARRRPARAPSRTRRSATPRWRRSWACFAVTRPERPVRGRRGRRRAEEPTAAG